MIPKKTLAIVLFSVSCLFLRPSWFQDLSHQLLSLLVEGQIQKALEISIGTLQPNSENIWSELGDIFPRNSSPNSRTPIGRYSGCAHGVNRHTQHIRLPDTNLFQIHMTPPDEPPSENEYFNPAILTLPPWSLYNYVLFSRLVTPGLHQETHYCPARVNTTTRDIYCSLHPRHLNIAPTAAYRCTGRWASFADIPGFHDPRVFWSGRGEPLIMVNSASAAAPNGCVGLWIIDLRIIIEELVGWMTQSVVQDRSGDEEDGDAGVRRNGRSGKVTPKISHPYLTEIMKNPRSSRHPVEKNWVLFFPQGDESWVMYDMVDYKKVKEGQNNGTTLHSQHIAGQSLGDSNIDEQDTHSIMAGISIWHSIEPQGVTFNLSTYLHNASSQLISISHDALSEDAKRDVLQERTPISDSRSDQVRLVPARTFAKLLGSGLTTPNLTSPREPPCFNDSHIQDSLNITGHWHQGSNSLRLVLCSRPGETSSMSQPAEECLLAFENEAELVEEGKVVHFMIMHRKFTNDFDLPLRYERYLLIWEARWPFHVVGLSHHPILFAGERARPWSEAENWPAEEVEAFTGGNFGKERNKWGETYFSYTPSLAWAARSAGMAEIQSETGQHLGTGYLGDEMIVGVGMDDRYQGFVRIQVDEILRCLRLCPYFEHQK